MQKLIVVVGPTASGKSELAVRLAKKFGGEVISADSRQVYRCLDIGTGKVPGQWRSSKHNTATLRLVRSYENESNRVVSQKGPAARRMFVYRGMPHHCIDFVPPRRVFTAAQFISRARRVISEIAQGGNIPIIAGGTAFWIDALVRGFSLPEVAPNARLRRALEKKSAAELLAILKKHDPHRAAEIEQKNPRRLIRAIEIARALGKVPRLKRQPAYHAFWIGINPAQDALTRRIQRRINAMIKQGLVAETKKLLQQKISKKRIREFGFEYAAALDAVAGHISRAELKQRIIRDTLRYAKRQMRWWKQNPAIRWIQNSREAAAAIKTSLQKNP